MKKHHIRRAASPRARIGLAIAILYQIHLTAVIHFGSVAGYE
jgi:hypothetical protein